MSEVKIEKKNKTDPDTRAFKARIRRRGLKLGAVALIAAAALERYDILYGLIFGICVGFINMNLMFFNLARLKSSPGNARSRTFSITIIRFAVIACAGIAAIYKKSFNPWAVLAGFLLTYAAIISIPITEGLKLKLLNHKSKVDAC